MLENILNKRRVSSKISITVKSVVSAGLVALAIILPQLIHAVAGADGGAKWMPMYFPVLLGGCLLGIKWGMCVGVLSPIVSYLVTLTAGTPMPAASRLPFMIIELAVFAAVSGSFGKMIENNAFAAFPAVLLAQTCGRAAFMLSAVIFRGVAPFAPAELWAQIQSGLFGLVLQAVSAPLIVIGLKYLYYRNDENRY